MSLLESSADVDAFIKRLEEQSVTKFITFSVDRHYNDKDWQPLPRNRVHWQWAGGSGMPAIGFTGIPFLFVGSKRLVCHQGKDLAVSQKRKYFKEKARKMLEEQSFGSQKSRRATTKKVGCPAAISISKIATFPKFKVDDNTERSKKTASKMLRMALERDPVVWETRYAVTHSSEHAGHANGRKETDLTSESGLPPPKRARKSDLRKKCIKLTKQLMDSLHAVEDQHTLEELSQVLGTLLKDLVPLSGAVDRKPFRLEAKTLGASFPLSQRCIGRQKHTSSPETLTCSVQEPPC
ncbi:uncharacterized protein LOC108238280 [Kryptolebias marmoratus]|uniref:uncharacterized protein LOC108230004 n=1 Tax=Kryptolebias marmoratus TaxID=37003 RepID=UPI0007F8D6BB|nr:uncharacterized protein LOC108230004 [Kryptolebias marmoratus]XP_017275737.1 uncharacterized protein LOC108238280 [Kryptolebias marmoratus]